MITEIEVEGVGTMRQVNGWQMVRIKRMANRQNQQIAFAAFGLGMTVRQFKQLPDDQRRAAWKAHDLLYGPAAAAPASPEPSRPRLPRPYERMDEAKVVQLGRDLIRIKGELPHGHFGLWVEEKSGITRSQAQRYMKAAKEAA